MRLIIQISLLTFLLFGCSNPNQNLIVVENDSEIDLTKLDSVRENLNGFWISENHIDSEKILWLDFHKTKNSATWEIIPYSEEIKQTEELPIRSCPTLASLIKLNGKVQIEFVGLVGSDTTEIKSLTITKFKIDGITYLRHQGYDFLKSPNIINEYRTEKDNLEVYKNSELQIFYNDFENEIEKIIWTDEPPGKLTGVSFRINRNKYYLIKLDSIPELEKMRVKRDWELNEVGKSKISYIEIINMW